MTSATEHGTELNSIGCDGDNDTVIKEKQNKKSVQIASDLGEDTDAVVEDNSGKATGDKKSTKDWKSCRAPLLPMRSQSDEEPDENETRQLRRYLKFYFYRAFKWKDNTCSIHLAFFLCFLVEVAKLTCVTHQMFTFGNDRGNFSDIVNRGDLTLRHLLLKEWDAGWETLPYPPTQGDFAIYDMDELTEQINYAVERGQYFWEWLRTKCSCEVQHCDCCFTPAPEQDGDIHSVYYNAPADAIGFYLRLPGDEMRVKMEYFDFVGFHTSKTTDDLSIMSKTFPVSIRNKTDPVTGEMRYSYDVEEDFSKHNLSQPIKRLLAITLMFSLHSVRVHYDVQKAMCLRMDGQVMFVDRDNNGQVIVKLMTDAVRVRCSTLGYKIPDASLRRTSTGLGTLVMMLTAMSFLKSILTLGGAVFVLVKTKQYMKNNYRKFYTPSDDKENDLPFSEYMRFIKLWDILVLVADVLVMVETMEIVFYIDNSNWTVASLDEHAVLLSVGCLLAWLCMLRYFKFHNKFHLLFTTLYHALWDVMTYLPCVAVLFIGFWVCGYVVLGPYNVKFGTPETAAENLFSMATGDELYVTFAILEANKSGGALVVWFNRVYIGVYVALFAVIVINILVAIFISAYECIKDYYREKSEDRDLSDMEKAIKRVLTSSHQHGSGTHALKSYLLYFLDSQTKLSPEEDMLRYELGKMIRISKDKKRILLNRPKTIQAFLEAEPDTYCRCYICSLVTFPRVKKE